jgi:hypothetical protein
VLRRLTALAEGELWLSPWRYPQGVGTQCPMHVGSAGVLQSLSDVHVFVQTRLNDTQASVGPQALHTCAGKVPAGQPPVGSAGGDFPASLGGSVPPSFAGRSLARRHRFAGGELPAHFGYSEAATHVAAEGVAWHPAAGSHFTVHVPQRHAAPLPQSASAAQMENQWVSLSPPSVIFDEHAEASNITSPQTLYEFKRCITTPLRFRFRAP